MEKAFHNCGGVSDAEDDEESSSCYGKNRKRRKRHHDDGTSSSGCSEEVGGKGADRDLGSCPEYLHHFFRFPGAANVDGDKAVVIFDNGKGLVERISYEELDKSATLLKEVLEKPPFANFGFVGVRCDVGITYPAIILGILRSGRAFFNIDKETWEEAVVAGTSHLSMKYFICESAWEPGLENRTFKLEKVADTFGNETFRFSMYEILPKLPAPAALLPSHATDSIANSRFAYAIQTSGTTGKKKTVLVPHVCICPNIYDFIHIRWRLTSEDVIFGCAPPTFDPHIVELFTALAVGGTILYTTSGVKQSSHLLTNILINHHVTVLQITPSLFRKVYVSFSNWREQLSLRIIAFGGEKCPNKSELGVMRDTISTSSELVFQNIYGVTEVSCWASVGNIDLTTDDPITIGEGIMDTEITVDGTSGEIILTSGTRYCVIIDPLQNIIDPSVGNVLIKPIFKYETGDKGMVVGGGIIFEGRMDRVVKRNGMKVSLFKIEEMALATGLVSYAECVLHKNKIILLVQLKPEFRKVEKCSEAGPNILLPSLSKTLDIPLFMYPDFTVALNVIPLNSNGKLDCDNVINSLMKVRQDIKNENVPFEITKEQVIKTLDPIWRSCTWPGIRSIDLLLRESFFEVGGDSMSAARFVESAFLSLKLFGTDTHDMYERNLMKKLIESSFETVVELICDILSGQNCLSTNFSNFANDLIETQEPLMPFLRSSSRDDFEYEMEDEEMLDDIYHHVFNQVDYITCDADSNFEILSPINFIQMYDFPLALCVDASPTIVKGNGSAGDKVMIGCHGGILICVDLSVLRISPNSSLAIAWKGRMPGRLEASTVLGESSLYAYVGCHDSNFYKFSVATGETICFVSCSAPIRSKGAVSEEYELVIVLDSGNCIYCLNYHDLNIMWVQTSYKFLATTTPIVWRNMCYISTLQSGLIALDLHSGKEIWNSSNRCHYSSPTLIEVKGEIASTKLGRKKYLVLTSSVTSASTEIVEARNAKTGRIEWSYMGLSPTSYPTVSQPLYNKCCDNIAWVSMSDFRLKDLNLVSGRLQHDLCCGFTHTNQIGRCCIIKCATNDKNVMRECTLFYKISGTNKFMLVNLHNDKVFAVKPWFIISDFDTFSIPVYCNEFILFGGRDNKLHIIKCQHVNKE